MDERAAVQPHAWDATGKRKMSVNEQILASDDDSRTGGDHSDHSSACASQKLVSVRVEAVVQQAREASRLASAASDRVSLICCASHVLQRVGLAVRSML